VRAHREADAKAKEIVDQARQAATDASATIETKAREEAQILLENAQREIRTRRRSAMATLRRESAELAIGLSRKIIGESLDESKSRDLVDRLIKTV
jgi:F-type H+-transporting ATPase subunit b